MFPCRLGQLIDFLLTPGDLLTVFLDDFFHGIREDVIGSIFSLGEIVLQLGVEVWSNGFPHDSIELPQMECLQCIKLDSTLTMTRLECILFASLNCTASLRPSLFFSDRLCRKIVCICLLTGQHQVFHLHIDREMASVAPPLDLPCNRYRHTDSVDVQIRDIEDAHGLVDSHGSLDKLIDLHSTLETGTLHGIDSKLLFQYLKVISHRCFFDPHLHHIGLITRCILICVLTDIGRWS